VADYIKTQLLKNSPNHREYLIDRYITFINKCKLIGFSGYTEKHHIIPRSLGGENNTDNIIILAARYHYIAHLILAKATGNHKMIKALHKMVYSRTGDVQRRYKITSRIYSFLREEHSKIVSGYSKNTVVAKQIYTEEIKRIPKELFEKYNGILYEAISKNRKDSLETKIKKQIASRRPRVVKQGLRSRSLAASKYSYDTPLGFCENSSDLLKLYPTFTKNTLTVIDNNVIITRNFCRFHDQFFPHIGKTFKECGIIKKERR
jgi:ribosomal protein S17E